MIQAAINFMTVFVIELHYYKKQHLYTSVIVSHIEHSKNGTVNLVVEHIVTTSIK